jgi:phospholipid/cholesterol/gamma-HCH transport system substrate-binding protein
VVRRPRHSGRLQNLFVVVDLTRARLKRTIFLGTRWGEEGAQLVPAPGDPYQQNYTYEPLNAPLQAPPTPDGAPPAQMPPSTPPVSEPLLPIAPPHGPAAATPTAEGSTPIFAGPYPADTPPDPRDVGGH